MKKNIKILGVVLTALVFTIGTVKADDPKKIDPKTGLPVKGNTSNQQGGKQKGNKDRGSLVEKLELTKEQGERYKALMERRRSSSEKIKKMEGAEKKKSKEALHKQFHASLAKILNQEQLKLYIAFEANEKSQGGKSQGGKSQGGKSQGGKSQGGKSQGGKK